jgi:hypothetical protein
MGTSNVRTSIATRSPNKVNNANTLKNTGFFSVAANVLLFLYRDNKVCSTPLIQKKLTNPAIIKKDSYIPISAVERTTVSVKGFIFVNIKLIINSAPVLIS